MRGRGSGVGAREQEVGQHCGPAHVDDGAHEGAEERAAGAERHVVVRLRLAVPQLVPHTPEQDARVGAEEGAADADRQPDDPAEAGHGVGQPQEASAHNLGHEDERGVVPVQRRGWVCRGRGGRAASGVCAHHLDLRRWSGVVLVTSKSASLASPSLLETDVYGCAAVGGGCAAILLPNSVMNRYSLGHHHVPKRNTKHECDLIGPERERGEKRKDSSSRVF